MAKKILAIALVAIVAVSAAACFVACEEEPTPYADLVAVRVNNFMAEWENIDYNFTYEGSSALKVSVPYTNYLEVNDLIVSPGAEYKVYEDEGKTKQLTDLSKIYVDGTKTLYIDVTNGELSNSYSVDVTVEQTNLPPESEIADKQYDNRGGHIYIPDGAETVEVDGVVYNVVGNDEVVLAIKENENIILSEDIEYHPAYTFTYSSIFDGNGFTVYVYNWSDVLVDSLEEGGILKNMIFRINGVDEPVTTYRRNSQAVCITNYGTIDNVVTDLDYYEFIRRPEEMDYDPFFYGYYAADNFGTIQNCLNKGNITSRFNNLCAQTASFVTRQHGALVNCVNVGMIQNEYPEYEGNGVGAIAYASSEDAVYNGVYNVGEVTHSRMPDDLFDKQLNGLIFELTTDNSYPDISRTKNYR